MIIFCITFLPNERAEAILAENGTTINPTPVYDNVTDVVVAPIVTTVSTDSENQISVLYFLYFFFDL